ncbi:Panacea domain-containing protein [Dongia mobilis]|jgi:uncharacterized phage-associated protein|uniref:Panacea domain-containing protein n=1 Tax=Dongia sp. TaxID=1977262 RepID=UPI0026EE2286
MARIRWLLVSLLESSQRTSQPQPTPGACQVNAENISLFVVCSFFLDEHSKFSYIIDGSGHTRPREGQIMADMPGYSARKSAQAAAFFAKMQGGAINILKLIKLLYLSDRESLQRYDMPILWDKFVAMPQGPVDSLTLNYVNGFVRDSDGWAEYVTDRKNHKIGLVRHDLVEDDLDELSDAEIGIFHDVWQKFGSMDQFELVDYTHKHCPEWEDPHGSSNPIPYDRVLKFLGKPNANEVAEEIESLRSLSESLAHAR